MGASGWSDPSGEWALVLPLGSGCIVQAPQGLAHRMPLGVVPLEVSLLGGWRSSTQGRGVLGQALWVRSLSPVALSSLWKVLIPQDSGTSCKLLSAGGHLASKDPALP